MPVYVVARFTVDEPSAAPADAVIDIIDANERRIGDAVTLNNVGAVMEKPLTLGIRFSLLEFTNPGQYSVRIKHGNDEIYTGHIFEVTQ